MKLPIVALLLATVLQAGAQQVTLHPQKQFPRQVPAGNYSGIARVSGDCYVVVDDKSVTAGFHFMDISIDLQTGQINSVIDRGLQTAGQPNRDEEGICYVPQTNTVFISGETRNDVIEYTLDGQPTGRQLAVPTLFKMPHRNGGLEALTYNARTRRFWTTSENTLKADGSRPDINHKTVNVLRLQSFGPDLQPCEQYWYTTDSSSATGTGGKDIIGVSGLAALDDGQLIVLERELRITHRQIGSWAHVKLYLVNPARQQPGTLLEKRLLAEFRTKMSVTNPSFANYEGIAVGPRLTDGRQVLLLVADSQNRYRGIMRDWFKTIVFTDQQLSPGPGTTVDGTDLLNFFTLDNPYNLTPSTAGFLTKDELPQHSDYVATPPAFGSDTFLADSIYYEWGKQQRTTGSAVEAAIDEVQSCARIFGPVAGLLISADDSPEINRLLERVLVDAVFTNRNAKNHYRRTRPFVHFGEPSLVPSADSAYCKSYSYPSGHSIDGWAYALTLALVVPDSTEALVARAQRYALNRVICGRHYKSDIDASLVEASALMPRLMANAEFREQLERAKKEYRTLRTR